MKRKLLVSLLAMCCLLILTGCCFHREWYAATCEAPKTCVECGRTEGEALGHSWTDATCTTPKTCSTCNQAEGEALGHSWMDATTDAPQTCSRCAATEGERIITDPRFTTASTKDLYGKWESSLSITPVMLGIEGFTGVLEVQISIELTNVGTMKLGYSVCNNEEFSATLSAHLENMLYTQFASANMDHERADAAMKAEYGMTVPEFTASLVAEMNLSAVIESLGINGVYYVDEGQLFSGISWDAEFGVSDFTVDGDTMMLVDEINNLTNETLVFTRVAK